MALLPLETIRDGFRTDPSLFPQNLDLARGALLVLLLDEPAFRAASFLDDRILSPQLQGRWVGFEEVADRRPPMPPQRPLHFIFHTGHVGSTLVSRLLDEIDGVLGLREPMALRVLAAAAADLDAPHALVGPAEWASLLDLLLACWGRGYADTGSIVVKATSSASTCCEAIAQALPATRAILLNLQPEPYLATLLAGQNTPLDLRGQAQERMRRLLRIAPSPEKPLHALSLGEIAAMTWTVETLTHRAAERRFGERMLRIDFDAFLAAPDIVLRKICAHFQMAVPDDRFARVRSSATLTRYSKAPEHSYSPDLRREVLTASRMQNAAEIRRGMGWIEAFARRYPEHASAL